MENDKRPQGGANPQDSLAPIQSHKLSIDAEASLMNRGRGRQVLGLAAIALVLGGLGILTLRHIGVTQGYLDAAAAAASIEESQFEGYFLCALPGATASQLTSPARVHTLFERAGDQLGKEYAATLKGCGVRLERLGADIDELSIPSAMSGEHAAVTRAVEQLKAAHAAYLGYLDDDSEPYEFAQATALIEKIGAAFEAYREANATLRKRLNDAA